MLVQAIAQEVYRLRTAVTFDSSTRHLALRRPAQGLLLVDTS
jgi:hypothetical protein